MVALEESVSQSGCSVGGDSVPLPGPHPCKRKMIAVPECHLAATWPMTLVQAQEDGTRTRGGGGEDGQPSVSLRSTPVGTAPCLDGRLAPAPGCHLPCEGLGSGFTGQACDNIWLSGS